MKSRTGFVSNSSSSSFVIIGYKLDTEFLDQFETENNSGIERVQMWLSGISDKLIAIKDSSNVYIGHGKVFYDDFGVTEDNYDRHKIENALAIISYNFNIHSEPRMYTGFIYD